MSANQRRSTPTSPLQLLRLRLPLLITTAIVVILGIFLWASYRAVSRVSIGAAGDRVQGAADELASLLSQSTEQRIAQLQRVAAQPVVREYLEHPSETTREALRAVLARLAGSGPSVIELWNRDGVRVLTVATPESAERALGARATAVAAGVSPLRTSENMLVSEVGVEVRLAERTASDRDASGDILGMLAVRRQATLSGGEVLNRLVGNGGIVQLGNSTDDVWTDLTSVVAAPPIDRTERRVVEYRRGDGEERIAAIVPIQRTPWAVLVELPRASGVVPAHAFLNQMLVMAGVFILGIALVVHLFSRRITSPLTELTEVSEALAAGDYGRRVRTARRDEIGRLGTAFNAMAEQVERGRRDLEMRVRERTEELDRFFSLSLDLLCIADTSGQFVRVNPAWQDALGWSLDDLTSMPFIEFVHPDDRGVTAAETAKLLDGRGTVNFENRYRCRDGSYRWLSWKAAAERGLIYAVARDVTAQKETASELQRQAAALQAARTEADRANVAKSDFLSRMSHELRTPLNAILGFAQVLELEQPRVDQSEAIYQILHGGKHLLALINEVIDISRIETGQLALSPESVSVRDVVTNAVALMKPLAAQRGITICVDLPDLDVAVRADHRRCNQILLNLLANAVKYNRDHGSVTIGCRSADPDRHCITVTDTGAGIPAAKLALLFQPFERLGSERTAIEGTGLGLALSRALAHAMGGTLGVESVVDAGSTFWLELPSAPVAIERLAVRALASAAESRTSEHRVVYIEDNASNVRLMERILLQRPGVRLVHAIDGTTGLALVRESRPDLVLLDMHLPDVSGEEVLRRLWEEPASRRVPVVVVTADATPGLVHRLQGLGASAHLTKPLDVARVLDLVDQFIRDGQATAATRALSA